MEEVNKSIAKMIDKNVEKAKKLASSTGRSMEEAAAITVQEALDKKMNIYMKCPMCNNEIEVAKSQNGSFTTTCHICCSTFGLDVAKEDK